MTTEKSNTMLMQTDGVYPMDNVIKIDGLTGLIDKIGEDEFIKLTIANSFFFDHNIVKDRQNELINLYKNQQLLPARNSTRKDQIADYSHSCIDGQMYYQEGGKNLFLIKIDHDGNREVRKLIKKKTGFLVSGGIDSDFQNYIISHVWGRAFDPRYFTNLWNIVIIPAWANSLMDKRSPEKGSIASKLQATIKAICLKLYFQNKCTYTGLDKAIMIVPAPPQLDEVLQEDYSINALCEKGEINPISITLE